MAGGSAASRVAADMTFDRILSGQPTVPCHHSQRTCDDRPHPDSADVRDAEHGTGHGGSAGGRT
ncbi:hypothetical protein GCM10009634_73750 [Saccharothrix xinjiangensis]